MSHDKKLKKKKKKLTCGKCDFGKGNMNENNNKKKDVKIKKKRNVCNVRYMYKL